MKNAKCFADDGKNCTALREKECKNCKFYRTDLSKTRIEFDIYNYGGTKKDEL